MTYSYAVCIEPTSTGFGAYVPDLPGCAAAGATVKETEDLIREGIRLHVEGMLEDGEAVPAPSSVALNVRVTISSGQAAS